MTQLLLLLMSLRLGHLSTIPFGVDAGTPVAIVLVLIVAVVVVVVV
jgi:hypothetical protein